MSRYPYSQLPQYKENDDGTVSERALLVDGSGNEISSTNSLPIQIADGANVTQGAKTDAPVTDPTLSASQVALLKGLLKQLQGTGTGAQSVSLTGSNTIKGAVQNVTTATSRVQLPNYPCREVTIIAKRGNTGYIYVGGNDVSSTVYGAELGTKDSVTLAVSNTNLIYIDASVSGEGVSYVAI